MSANRRTSHIFAAIVMIFVFGTLSAAPLYLGTWTKARTASGGGWQVIEDGERVKLVLDRGFKTKKPTDLKLFLVNKPVNELRGDDVVQGAVRLGPLLSLKGLQEYQNSVGTDLSIFRTLVIHCEKYSEL